MLRIAGQTAGPIGLNFLWTLMGAHVQKVELQKVERSKGRMTKGRTIKR